MQSQFGILTAHNFPLKSIFVSLPRPLLLWKNIPIKMVNADSFLRQSPLSDSHQEKAEATVLATLRKLFFTVL